MHVAAGGGAAVTGGVRGVTILSFRVPVFFVGHRCGGRRETCFKFTLQG